MKRFLQITCIILLLGLSLCITTTVRAEAIQNFLEDVKINSDGTIRVTETISYDFGATEKHGIFRILPTVKTNVKGEEFRTDITQIDITNENNETIPYHVGKQDTLLNIRIGDANKTVSGIQTYKISYLVSGALTYFSDHDELYWNVTGNAWGYPIHNAKATVSFESLQNSTSLTATCYTGKVGSTDKNCTPVTSGNEVTVLTSQELDLHEGLTIVVGFPKGSVAVLEPKKITSPFSNPVVLFLLAAAAFFWYIILPIWICVTWFQKGRPPKPTIGTPDVWFSPPKTKKLRELTPGETGGLYDERVDTKDITGTIVDLARRGFFTIVEESKDNILLKKKEKATTGLLPFEETLYTALFSKSPSVKIQGLSLVSTVKTATKEIFAELITEGFLTKDPDPTRILYQVLSVFALMTANIPLLITSLLFGNNMSTKTQEGSNNAEVAKALRGFLKSQDKQYKFQAQHLVLFEKMLPYAIAFGVEKEWAKRFEALDMPTPDWYVGPSGSHSSILFVSQLSHSMTSFQSSMTPTSSSSGFSSGFSGGSSGGGGGGGGGGSW